MSYCYKGRDGSLDVQKYRQLIVTRRLWGVVWTIILLVRYVNNIVFNLLFLVQLSSEVVVRTYVTIKDAILL